MSGDKSPKMPGAWVDSDEVAVNLATLTISSGSKTIEMDDSQPPTPDGTGRPVNFQIIAPGLYRSSYPHIAHFENLKDLTLKTIVTLVPEALSPAYKKFITDNTITHHHIPILANKDAEVYTSDDTVCKVLELMLDSSNYPMLIHCNKGKHRTGCITATFRRVTGWTIEACIHEYERYSRPKDRELDKIFIGRFNPLPLKHLAMERGYVGGVYRQPVFGSTNFSTYTTTTVDTAYTTTDDSTIDNLERVSTTNDLIKKAALACLNSET